MAEVKIRTAVSPDFSLLSAFNHTVKTDMIWQMDRVAENGFEAANFREIRLPRPIQVDYPYSVDNLLDRSKTMAVVLLACMDEVPVGYIGLSTLQAGSTSWIRDLAVHERWQRRGFASVLLKAALHSKCLLKIILPFAWHTNLGLSSVDIMSIITPIMILHYFLHGISAND
jgi:GNAT superfamily N-acetyltransferase